MSAILSQLGIDWHLLLSQGVNFLVALVILTIFVWKPLLKLMEGRRKKIEEGISNAGLAEKRLGEIDILREEKLAETGRQAQAVIERAEKKAGERREEIIAQAEVKASTIQQEGITILKRKRDEQFAQIRKDAKILLKEALALSISKNPESINNVLIEDALNIIKKETVS